MLRKRMLIVLVLCLLAAALFQFLLSSSPPAVAVYAGYIFYPFQLLRNYAFRYIPFSIGDIIYIGVCVWIITLLLKGLYKLLKKQVSKRGILLSLQNVFIAFGIAYLWFFVGWAGNYHKPALAKHWHLGETASELDSTALVAFDIYLIGKLNEYASRTGFPEYTQAEELAREYYRSFPATKGKVAALKIKPSLFGNMLEYSGVQGYYNPFTGEGQANANLPDFIQPFLLCHEMAHQAGIAAEDDANLLAFAVCTNSKDPAFIYSSYFNIWLYTNSRLRRYDTTLARSLQKTLNPVTTAHIDTLRALRRKYRSPLSRYSSAFYDNYLKLHAQEKGLESYDDVVFTAWAWEQRRSSSRDLSLP